MTFIIELFEYLMSEHDTDITIIVNDVFKKICDDAKINSISSWNNMHMIEGNVYKCVCCLEMECNQTFNLANDTVINKIFLDNDVYKYYTPVIINNEKYL